MTYQPISEDKKQEHIKWLESIAETLEGKPDDKSLNDVFQSPDGDVATGKDLVGIFLATLKNKSITIN